MLKNKFILLSFLGLSYFLSCSAYANTQDTTCSCKHRMEQMTKELHLTNDQQAKIQAIKESNKSTIKENWTKLKSIRSQMNELAMSKTVDDNKLNDLINQKTTLTATMMKNKVMVKNQIFNLLTAEQQQKYKDNMNNWESSKNHHCTSK